MAEKTELKSSNFEAEINEKTSDKQPEKQIDAKTKNFLIILVLGVSCAGLYFLSRQNYLLFHSTVEVFSILIAFAIFIIAWNTRHITNNTYVLFIGIAFLFVGALALMHTLAYKNLGVFPGVGTNLATQLWIATRCLLSLSLLVAPLFINHKIRPIAVFVVYTLVSTLLLASIFIWNIFPVAFIDPINGIAGHLTTFKIASEYGIAIIFGCAIVLTIQKRKESSANFTKLVVAAMAVAIAADMAFTLYNDAYGLANMFGHLLNVVSFYLIYKALIETTLTQPFTLLFHNLKQNEFNLTRQKTELTETNKRLEREVTERKRAEQELIKSEAKYFSLFANMLNGFAYCRMVFDEAGKPVDFVYLEINSAFERLTGLKKEEVVGKKVTEAIPGIEKVNSELFAIYGRVALTGKEETFEVFFEPLKIWFSIGVYSPKKGYFAALFENITQRKKAEEKLKESTQKIELMNEKLQVVGGLSRHDVRNKLSAINGYVYLLKKKYTDQTETLEQLNMIDKSIKDAVKIFEFAKMYEQIGVEELTYINVKKTIDEARTLFPDLQIKIINDCQGLTVLADSLLRQMIYNFMDNTRKYGEKTTSIRVHYEKEDTGKLLLIYEDDGIGISTKNKQNLFTEGFSTGGSTGFGLFLIRQMMNVYGWTIQEIGELGKGVKFLITIPKLNKNGEENYQIAQ